MLVGYNAWSNFLARGPTFLAIFAYEIYASQSSEPFYEVFVPMPENIYPGLLRHFYEVHDGVIQRIEIQTGSEKRYWLPMFLEMYGAPGEVWLVTASKPRDDTLGFVMVLFYPKRGILIEYQVPWAEVRGNSIQACPQDALFPGHLSLWSAEDEMTFPQALSQTLGFGKDEIYRALTEATGMDIETFYQTFRNHQNHSCLNTPVDLWP